jgi:hypothetical protein
MCNKAALMQAGRIVAIGPVDEVYEQYDALVREAASKGPANARKVRGDGIKFSGLDVYPDMEFSPDDRPRPTERPIYSEESIKDVNLGDRLARSNGAARITRAVAKNMSGATCWTFSPGDTARFIIEYEVMKPVADLVLIFRLKRFADDGAGQSEQVVTDIYEELSTVPLEAGHTGAIQLTLPNLRLMANPLFIYVWIGRIDYTVSYDVIDANVALPMLVINDGAKRKRVYGVVTLDYQIKKIERKLRSELAPEPQG